MTDRKLLAALNPEQREAVLCTEGPLLVLAGAGSGKTRVVTTRVAHLLGRGVAPSEILAVTFTNKAADEMRERIEHFVGQKKAADVTISTFHALGLRILQAEARARPGRKQRFAILDQGDQIGIVRELMRRKDAGRTFDAWALLERISKLKNLFVRPTDTLPKKDEYDVMAADLYADYEDEVDALAAYDFDDLIVEPVRLIEENPEARARWHTRFKYVHVDEYQDTSPAQLRLTMALSGARNLCVVGDDDQSIYAWRGADVRNILQFSSQFPDAKTVKLEENYRSTPIILEAANGVISKNEVRHPKRLRTSKVGGELIEVVTAAGPEDEASFVVNEIKVLVDSGRKHQDIAILFRASNLTQPFEELLRLENVPFRVASGGQFYGRKEVKDGIAYLRTLVEPRDELALRRIVNYPARGIGPATMAAATNIAHERHTGLWQALHHLPIDTPGGRAASIFVEQMTALRKQVGAMPFGTLASHVFETMGIRADLAASSTNGEITQKRWNGVLDLIKSIEAYERRTAKPNMAQYLNLLTLRSSNEEEENTSDVVTLTTLHASKGLEYPVVFIIGFEEDILPHSRTLNPRAQDNIVGDISEERRLCYVGITRARERLYLTRSATRVQRSASVVRAPSRFLADIPPALIRERTLEELEGKRREKNQANVRAAMRALFDD